MGQMSRLVIFSENLRSYNNRMFQDQIWRILRANNQLYSDIRRPSDGYSIFDFTLTENSTGKKIGVCIQRGSLVSVDVMTFLSMQWNGNNDNKCDKIAIVCDGEFDSGARKDADVMGFELWDIYFLYKLFNQSLKLEANSEEHLLIRDLRRLNSGKEDSLKYQKLISDILIHLFCPPLENPRYEISDADGKNRRDIILENSSNHQFWSSLRNYYKAHYIVVDAKNYAELIDKPPITDVAYYLKDHGCGLFGLIVCRKGGSDAAIHAVKENWISNQKMIVILNDNDIEDMLMMKFSGLKPEEELIRQKIASFRISL